MLGSQDDREVSCSASCSGGRWQRPIEPPCGLKSLEHGRVHARGARLVRAALCRRCQTKITSSRGNIQLSRSAVANRTTPVTLHASSSKTAAPTLPIPGQRSLTSTTQNAPTLCTRVRPPSLTPCASPGLCSSTSSGPPAARRAAGGRRPPAGSTCAAGSLPRARSSPWPPRRRRAERSGARAHLELGLGFVLGLGLGLAWGWG